MSRSKSECRVGGVSTVAVPAAVALVAATVPAAVAAPVQRSDTYPQEQAKWYHY